MFENICRICSNRANYNIFSNIPAYLHESINDFVYWKKEIYIYLEETTGLVVDSEDGLPQKMCALCISYLKHACTFRQQAIDNTLSLKAALAFCKPLPTVNNTIKTSKDIDVANSDKESNLITAKDLAYSEKRKTDTNNLANNETAIANKSGEYMKKFLNCDKNETNSTQVNGTNDALKQYVNLLFDKQVDTKNSPRRSRTGQLGLHIQRMNVNNEDESMLGSIRNPLEDVYQTASSGDDEMQKPKKDFFSYKQKNFEEDDIMDAMVRDANIVVNIPQEKLKERKCPACFRRFMFEHSYNEHTELCIEYKFLVLIEEINRLLDIRRQKVVSPHEFIRRIIFCLKKTGQWLQTHCGEILLPELQNLNNEKVGDKSSATDMSVECKNDDTTIKIENEPGVKLLNNETFIDYKQANLRVKLESNKNNGGTSNTGLELLNILKVNADASLIRYINKGPDPLLLRLKSNGSITTSTPQPNDLRTVNRTNLPLLCSQLEQQISLDKKLNAINKKLSNISQKNRRADDQLLNNYNQTTKNENPKGFARIPTSDDDEEKTNKKLRKYKRLEKKFALKFQALTETNCDDMQNSLKSRLVSIKRKNIESIKKQTTETKLISPLFQRVQICPVKTELPFRPVFPSFGFSAKCPTCMQPFDSISSLEQHNAKYHNDKTKLKENQGISIYKTTNEQKPDGFFGIF